VEAALARREPPGVAPGSREPLGAASGPCELPGVALGPREAVDEALEPGETALPYSALASCVSMLLHARALSAQVFLLPVGLGLRSPLSFCLFCDRLLHLLAKFPLH
jgi:hypothetical protein